MSTKTVTLPHKLARFADPATRPPFMKTADVKELVEFWWPVNGKGFIEKLVRCGSLTPVHQKFKHKRVFDTNQVLSLYHSLTG